MLERDYLLIQIFSKEIVDRRIDVLKSGLMHNAAPKSDWSFFKSSLNLFGVLALSLFLILISG